MIFTAHVTCGRDAGVEKVVNYHTVNDKNSSDIYSLIPSLLRNQVPAN